MSRRHTRNGTETFEYSRVLTSFSVDDVPAAEGFYGRVLGLRIALDEGALLLHLADGQVVLVYPKPDHVPATYTVLNFVVGDIDEAVRQLVERGVRFLRYERSGADETGIIHGPDRDIAWFADPAGNVHSVATLKRPLAGAGDS